MFEPYAGGQPVRPVMDLAWCRSKLVKTSHEMRHTLEVDTCFVPLVDGVQHQLGMAPTDRWRDEVLDAEWRKEHNRAAEITKSELEHFERKCVEICHEIWNHRLWLHPHEDGKRFRPIACELRVNVLPRSRWQAAHLLMGVVKPMSTAVRTVDIKGSYRSFARLRGAHKSDPDGRDYRHDYDRPLDACLNINTVESKFAATVNGQKLFQRPAAHELGHHLGLNHPRHVDVGVFCAWRADPAETLKACVTRWIDDRDHPVHGHYGFTGPYLSPFHLEQTGEIMGRGEKVTRRCAKPWESLIRLHGLIHIFDGQIGGPRFESATRERL